MAAQYSYAIDLIAQTSKFEQNVQSATGKIINLAKSTQAASAEVVNLSRTSKEGFGKVAEGAGSAMGSLGSAIGGVNGNVISLCGELAAAAGPIGIIVALIGGIAMAWKTSEENVKSYLERVEKTKMDPAIFNRSSKEALKDSKASAQGGVTEGIRLREAAQGQLGAFGADYTEEQKKQLVAQIALGDQMVIDNKLLLKSMGYQDGLLQSQVTRVGWIQKYNKLQSERDQLDEDKISAEGERNDLESELLVIKTKIMSQEGTIAEREKLKKDYEEKATVIAKNKLEILNRELKINGELYKMTGEGEKAELLTLNSVRIEKQIRKELSADIFATVRLMNSINKAQNKIMVSVEQELARRKEINGVSEAGYKLGTKGVGGIERQGYANTGFLLKDIKPISKKPELPNDLAGGPDTLKNIANIVKTLEAEEKLSLEMERQQAIANALSGSINEVGTAFGDMLAGGEGAMKGLISVLITTGNKIVDIYLAEAVAATIAKDAALPFGLIIASVGIAALLAFWQAKVPAFAEGGLVSGPTIGMMGEYPGARSNPEVIAPLSKLQNMLQPAMSGGQVVFRIEGRELVGVLAKESRVTRNIRGR